jgi:sporulation protein YlmC with PRC-barrel domain
MDNTTRTDTSSTLIDSKSVEGSEVFDAAGKHIGTVNRLVIDKISGRIVYAIAQFGGFLGMGGDEYTIPWNTLHYDTSLGGYVTVVTQDQLNAAPAYARNTDNNWFQRDDERTLHDHYGSDYYWDE